jgi:hypothetical protein
MVFIYESIFANVQILLDKNNRATIIVFTNDNLSSNMHEEMSNMVWGCEERQFLRLRFFMTLTSLLRLQKQKLPFNMPRKRPAKENSSAGFLFRCFIENSINLPAKSSYR